MQKVGEYDYDELRKHLVFVYPNEKYAPPVWKGNRPNNNPGKDGDKQPHKSGYPPKKSNTATPRRTFVSDVVPGEPGAAEEENEANVESCGELDELYTDVCRQKLVEMRKTP